MLIITHFLRGGQSTFCERTGKKQGEAGQNVTNQAAAAIPATAFLLSAKNAKTAIMKIEKTFSQIGEGRGSYRISQKSDVLYVYVADFWAKTLQI